MLPLLWQLARPPRPPRFPGSDMSKALEILREVGLRLVAQTTVGVGGRRGLKPAVDRRRGANMRVGGLLRGRGVNGRLLVRVTGHDDAEVLTGGVVARGCGEGAKARSAGD